MIVDCHTHIACSGSSVNTSDHLAACEAVDACFVLAGPGGKSDETNKELSGYVSQNKSTMIGFAVVNPVDDAVTAKAIASLKNKLGLSGIVLHCSAAGFHPAHSRAMRLYEAASENSMPVFFHNASHLDSASVLEYSQPYLLDEIARSFKDLKIIIGTMGLPFVEQALTVAAKHENVYVDLSGAAGRVWQIYNFLMSANEFGVLDNLLFGSGFPAAKVQGCMESLLGLNQLLSDTSLPVVPLSSIRGVIERDSLKTLGIERVSA